MYTAKAQCPSGPVSFIARDSVNHSNIANTTTLSCGANPIYIEADNSSYIVTPCVLSEYYLGLLSGVCSNATETFYEGGNDLLCIGPSSSGCVFPIGGGGCPVGYWDINKIYLDPSQQHDFVFSYSSLLNISSNVQLLDCWAGTTTLSPVNSFNLLGGGTFTDIVPANTDIGTAIYSISPATASVALTDNHNGRSVVNPALLPSGSYTVNYTFIPPSASCPTTTVTGTFKFTIAPIPLSVNSPTICAGSTTTLTASAPPAITYSWSPATNLSATTGSVVSTNALSNTAIYTVTATQAACTATATSTITVNPIPTLTLSSVSICAGTTVALTAQGATNYSWTPSTGLTASTGSMVSTTSTLSTTTVYTVTGTSSGCSSAKTTTVTVNQTPTVTVNSPTICAGATATLTASGATTYSWNTSSMSATITPSPTITTTYTVTGTTSGCSSVKTSTVTVNPTPTVTVNSATICAGATATLTASGATTYSWSTAGTNASIAPSPTITTSYTVTGTNIYACKKSATSTITVNPLPIISINNATICTGGTATLTASGATTYSWSTSATSASITPSPTITTTYTVIGTSLGCASKKTSTVTVNPTPTVTVNSSTICAGSTASLTANGANTYSWSTGATVASISISPTSTSNYTVTGTSLGCSSKATSTVTVIPTASITVSTNLNSLCAGNSATLTATGASTYTWSPAATLSSANGGTVIAIPVSNTNYTVSGIAGGCAAKPAFITLTVTPLPIVSVNNASICFGASTILTANGTAATYNWSPATGLSATTGSLVTANPSTTTIYTITATTATCSSIKTATLTVNQLPTVTVLPVSTTICSGNSATLTASGANTYTWNTSTTGTSITTTPTLSTTYTVTGTDIHACVNSATTMVSVNALPVVTPTANTPVCVGQTIKFNATTGSFIYSWSGPNGYTSSSQNPIITNATIANMGVYILSVTSAGCSTSDTIHVIVDALPTIANAGMDTVMYTSSSSLNGNIPVVGTGVWSIVSGGGIFANNTNANTLITNLPSGTNVLKWTISNGACPDSYDELTIIVKDLIVPNGFSPNGDGVNDVFEINGLEEYSNVKINVFNRWGNLVYDNGDYKNNWGGKNMSGEDLSDDTYFYTIEIPTKSNLKGYVILKRK